MRDQTLAIRDVGFLSEVEMHRRSAGSTPYELGHDAAKHSLERILAMAELASSPKPDVAASRESADGALAKLKEGLRDRDSGVRYWAALGFSMRDGTAVNAVREELRAALKEESPSVRVAAARALGQHGNADDLALALATLKELAPPDKNGVFVSLEALSATEALGRKADPLWDFLRTMPRADPNATERTAKYVANFLQHLLSAAGKIGPSDDRHKPSP